MPADQCPALPVSVYFVWQWWEEHYQRFRGRPQTIDLDWLDETYLGRQKFLFEAFGRFGIGQAEPELNRGFVSKVLPFHCVILPAAFGASVRIKEVGGYTWETLSVEELQELPPVDIAETALAEMVVAERDQKLARYGTVSNMLDIGSPTNVAFMLRGHEFYADLLTDQSFARHYLAAITESICLAYRFASDIFDPLEGFALGNCNVVMMSPALYAEMVREYDVRCVEYAAKLNGADPRCNLHHCNVPAEAFAEAYSLIPGVQSVQASYLSDVRKVKQAMPQASFSAMVNPAHLLSRPLAGVCEDVDRCIADGATDLAVWDIDPGCGPRQMSELLDRLTDVASAHGRRPSFTVIPFAWEELDWEFRQYRGEEPFSLSP